MSSAIAHTLARCGALIDPLMNYVEKYFGKAMIDLSYSDIQSYFEESKEESNIIEYKSFSTEYGNTTENLKGVIRTICALLNSEGGIAVWGSPIGRIVESKKEKIFQGSLTPIPELIEKDKLINKISDSISPMPICSIFYLIPL
jgi:glutaminase